MLKQFNRLPGKAASHLELVLMIGIIVVTLALMASYVIGGGGEPYYAGIAPAVDSLLWRLLSVGTVLAAIGVALGYHLHVGRRKFNATPGGHPGEMEQSPPGSQATSKKL